MKKIQAKKTESAAAVIGKVISASEESVSVYIPRGSKFASSRNNFLLLKREARAAGKEISVESVDDEVLELAATSGLKAVNPFRGRRQRAVSDMVAVNAPPPAAEGEQEAPDEKSVPSAIGDASEVVDESEGEDKPFVLPEAGGRKRKRPRVRRPALAGLRLRRERAGGRIDEGMPRDIEVKEGSRMPARMKRMLVVAGGIGAVGTIVAILFFVLPRVTIVLNFEKTPWSFVGSLAVSSDINQSRFVGDTIELRGVSFIEERNMTKNYPASGREFVERKAKGTMIVYNAYSSEEQQLVATTRFVTPDGKIYRTDRDIVVPGANIEEGAIIPSSTTVPVTADEAGEEYNIGPVPRFRIPGFQSTPKYDGFYGESVEPMTGGFVGERMVPTDEDKEKARADIIRALEDAVQTALRLNLPDDITVLDGAYRFSLTEEIIDEGASDSDTFTMTARGEGRVIGFRESELADVVRIRVEDEAGVSLAARSFNVEYGAPEVNETGTAMTVAVRIDSEWTQPFDVLQFKKDAMGRNETELKELAFSIPGIQGMEARFWPIWVTRVPDKENRIIVDVE